MFLIRIIIKIFVVLTKNGGTWRVISLVLTLYVFPAHTKAGGTLIIRGCPRLSLNMNPRANEREMPKEILAYFIFHMELLSISGNYLFCRQKYHSL